jgi:N-acetylmuramoyl-L-alanine amidase-like protein
VFEPTVYRRSITRRHALKLGAAAAAGVALAPRSARAASCRVPVFEVGLETQAAAAAGGWRTLPVMRAPRRFDMLGLRWAPGTRGVHAQVRARRSNGSWTPWTALHVLGDHAPDSGRVPAGTEPCWTDSADYFQVRLQGHPHGLRARFVRAKPTAQLSRRSAMRLGRTSASKPATGSQAGPPPIVARSAWGGDSCQPRSAPEYGAIQLAFVHHTVTANDYGPEDSASIVLGICKYHRDHNGWNDIGYNFLVDRYGQVFEGRAGGTDQAVIGAHAQGWNTDSTGIACLGDFTGVAQTPQGMDALARLVAWKLSLHGVPVTGQITLTSRGGSENRYPSGTVVTFERISGHRDGDSTSCPGDTLYGQLPDLRSRATGYATPVSAVSLRAARTTVRYPSALALSGTVRFSDGAPTDGTPVQVQFQTAGAAWQVIATARADAAGTWTASVPTSSSGAVRAVYGGDGAHASMASTPISIKVLPRLSIALSARRVSTGRKVGVTGTLGPTWPRRIELRFERRVRGRWVNVQRKRINVRGGGYSTIVRPRQAGLYRVTVVAPGVKVARTLRATDVTGGAAAG